MGLLDIYDNTITNPKPLTTDYFETRPKIKDFELVIDGIKAILVNAGYYLPEF